MLFAGVRYAEKTMQCNTSIIPATMRSTLSPNRLIGTTLWMFAATNRPASMLYCGWWVLKFAAVKAASSCRHHKSSRLQLISTDRRWRPSTPTWMSCDDIAACTPRVIAEAILC